MLVKQGKHDFLAWPAADQLDSQVLLFCEAHRNCMSWRHERHSPILMISLPHVIQLQRIHEQQGKNMIFFGWPAADQISSQVLLFCEAHCNCMSWRHERHSPILMDSLPHVNHETQCDVHVCKDDISLGWLKSFDLMMSNMCFYSLSHRLVEDVQMCAMRLFQCMDVIT